VEDVRLAGIRFVYLSPAPERESKGKIFFPIIFLVYSKRIIKYSILVIQVFQLLVS